MVIKIIIADDHEFFRTGITTAFKGNESVTIIDQAENGEHLLEKLQLHLPNLVLTDIQMPKMDGIRACIEIKKCYPAIPVIALTSFNETSLIFDMLDAGASGILLKSAGKDEVIKAIEAVVSGGTHFSPDIMDNIKGIVNSTKLNKENKPYGMLSEREREILIGICEGLSSKELGAKLKISSRTVEGHKVRIQEKTQSRSLANLIIYAVKNRIFRI